MEKVSVIHRTNSTPPESGSPGGRFAYCYYCQILSSWNLLETSFLLRRKRLVCEHELLRSLALWSLYFPTLSSHRRNNRNSLLSPLHMLFPLSASLFHGVSMWCIPASSPPSALSSQDTCSVKPSRILQWNNNPLPGLHQCTFPSLSSFPIYFPLQNSLHLVCYIFLKM